MNYVEIQEILNELPAEKTLLLQNVIQNTFDRLYFEFFDGQESFWLVFVLKGPYTRFHLCDPPRKQKNFKPRFAEFLNANFRNSRVRNLRQWENQRLVLADLEMNEERYQLVFRLWNNAANCLVLDEKGIILDCFLRRPLKEEMTAKPFYFPEVQSPRSEKIFSLPEYPREGPRPFNAYIAALFTEKESLETWNVLKSRAEKLLQNAQAGSKLSKERLKDQLSRAETFEQYKLQGDMILAQAWNISRGASWVDLDDWMNPGEKIRISLDPKLDAKENAQKYYQRFQKSRDSRSFLQEDLGRLESKLEKLSHLEEKLNSDPSLQELQNLLKDLEVYDSKDKSQAGVIQDEMPGVRFFVKNHLLLVGRNSTENDELLRRHVRGNDWWLHVRDYSGSYVFIKTNKGKAIPEDVLIDAAHLAAWYSKGKNEKELDLYYTQVKYLRRAKFGPKGTVLPTQERNLHLLVEESRLKSLLG